MSLENFGPNIQRKINEAEEFYPETREPLPEHNNHPYETLIAREDIDVRLFFQIQNKLQDYQEQLEKLSPDDRYDREVLEEQIENNQITLESLLSKISPSKLEEFLKKPE